MVEVAVLVVVVVFEVVLVGVVDKVVIGLVDIICVEDVTADVVFVPSVPILI